MGSSEDGKPIIAGYPLPHWEPRRRIRTVCANSQKQIYCIIRELMTKKLFGHKLKQELQNVIFLTQSKCFEPNFTQQKMRKLRQI